jgi:hypothetical protein
MKRVLLGLLLVSGLLVRDPTLFSQPHRSTSQHWTETESETLWRTRYSNEDYGFYVLLDAGTIGHGTHSPAPNHGFLVSLPDVGREQPASANEERFVWVDASYNTSEYQTLSSVSSERVHLMDDERGAPHFVEHKFTRLAGLTAILFRIEYSSPKGTVVEEQIIALRSGIIYTIGLKTTKVKLAIDKEQFRRIQSGFKLLTLHNRAVPQLRIQPHPVH